MRGRAYQHRGRAGWVWLAAAVLALTPVVAGAEPAANPLRFALLSTQAPDEVAAKWQPVLDALGRRIGADVVADVTTDYAGAIWGLRNGRDHLALLGNKSAIEAVDHGGGEVFAKESFLDSRGGYFSLLIVAQSSPYRSADDVIDHAATLTLGRGDTNSTSGTVVPGYYLFALRGINPALRFKRVVQGNHEGNILAVAEGRVDAASVASSVFDDLRRSKPDLTDRVRVVWRSPLIPGDPLVWRKDLPATTKAAVREFFLEYGIAKPGKSAARLAEEQANLKRLGSHGFQASDDGQLLQVRRLELERTRLQLTSDGEGTPTPIKLRQRQEIDRKLAEIDRQSRPWAE